MNIKDYFDEKTKVIEAAFPDVPCCFSVANYGTMNGLTFFLHAGDNVGTGKSFFEAMDNLEKTVNSIHGGENEEGQNDRGHE